MLDEPEIVCIGPQVPFFWTTTNTVAGVVAVPSKRSPPAAQLPADGQDTTRPKYLAVSPAARFSSSLACCHLPPFSLIANGVCGPPPGASKSPTAVQFPADGHDTRSTSDSLTPMPVTPGG